MDLKTTLTTIKIKTSDSRIERLKKLQNYNMYIKGGKICKLQREL